MVTGRISLRSPEYSPISSSVSEVRASSSRRHCRPDDGVGHQDQRGRAGLGHRGGADQGLAGAAGQHDDTRAAGPEPLDGLLLVGAQVPVAGVQLDVVRLAVDVAGLVLGRPADLEQRLLEVAALGRVHDHGVLVDPGAEHRRDLLVPQDLLEHRPVPGHHDQPVRGVGLQHQPAVAAHGVDDVDQQRLRDREAGPADQGVDDLLGVVPGGAGVPQRQRGDPVGVDVLGGAFEFGERRDVGAGRRRHRGGAISSSSVLSDWTINGPSVTGVLRIWCSPAR